MSKLPEPSTCGRFHILSDGSKVYNQTFDWVLPFHEPGLAPVGDESGAYHIHLNGSPAYIARLDRTFGYYCGLAAVQDGDAWYHLDSTGERAYEVEWAWCGNFQHERCPVRTHSGDYHHIRLDGLVLSGGPHAYAGDFREGAAVVRGSDGLCCHIDIHGNRLHDGAYFDLDVYHKGFARARDAGGWFHIDKDGRDVSEGTRYSGLEPFYNGQALGRDHLGNLIVIDESNEVVIEMVRSTDEVAKALQNLSTTFWKPLAIRFGILAGLAGDKSELSLNRQTREVLTQAWIELGLLTRERELTDMGSLLRPGEAWRDRLLFWTGPQFTPWIDAENRLEKPSTRPGFFELHSKDLDTMNMIHRVLDSYAQEDWQGIADQLLLPPRARVVDLGGGRGALMKEIGGRVSSLVLVDLPEVVDGLEIEGVEIIGADIFSDELPTGDVYILSRVLHDWPDVNAIELLNKIPQSAEIIIIDRNADEARHGLLSLNMLLVNGGRERTSREWSNLFADVGRVLIHESEWKEHSIMHLGC